MAQIIIRRAGTCLYCGNEFDVRGMARHLSACTARKRVVEETARRRVSNSDLYHLRVQDEWSKDFWIDVEMKGTESLGSLDHYLRAIWLECCGHLSMFSRSGWNSHEFPPEARIREVFRPGIQISYIYDFGSSSEMLIRNVSIRTGKPIEPRYPVALMARNVQPASECITCGESATWLCFECIIEHETWGTLCERHSATHPHKNYGDPGLLVNSPRMGMCGYDGPAKPPY